jgi:hypothetical protein
MISSVQTSLISRRLNSEESLIFIIRIWYSSKTRGERYCLICIPACSPKKGNGSCTYVFVYTLGRGSDHRFHVYSDRRNLILIWTVYVHRYSTWMGFIWNNNTKGSIKVILLWPLIWFTIHYNSEPTCIYGFSKKKCLSFNQGYSCLFHIAHSLRRLEIFLMKYNNQNIIE